MYGTQFLSEHDFRVCGVNFVQFAPFPPILKPRLDITVMADWAFKISYLSDFFLHKSVFVCVVFVFLFLFCFCFFVAIYETLWSQWLGWPVICCAL